MGLEFKTFNTLASRMSSFAKIPGLGPIGSGSKPAAKASATPSVLHSAAPTALPKTPAKAASLECADFNRTGKPCSRGKKCRNPKCRDASATSPKSAVKGGDGGVSAQISAMEVQLSSMHAKVDGLTKQVATGFTETKSMLTDQQQATLGMQKAMEALMMASAGFQSSVTGLLSGGSAPRCELPAHQARLAICASGDSNVTELVEPSRKYTHSCFTSNEGGSASHSSQRSHSGAAFGGGAANDSSRFATEFRESSGGSTLVAARQLGVSHLLPNFEAAAARWNMRNNVNNAKILNTIRQMARGNDDMACLLLALVNGKTLSEIDNMYSREVGKLLSDRNTPFFQEFFKSLCHCGLPTNFDVKVDSSKTKLGSGFCMTYLQLSQAPGNVDKLVRILRVE